MPAAFSGGSAWAALSDLAITCAYRDRASAYWNSIVSGGRTFVESIGKLKDGLVSLINEGSSEKSLADIKALSAKTGGNCAIACDANDSPLRRGAFTRSTSELHHVLIPHDVSRKSTQCF
ncbi:hypothetical protein [Bradyrhizobium sp. UFLA05-112]